MSRRTGRSYCREKTQSRVLSLWMAALFLFMALALGVYGYVELQADQSEWGYMEYVKLVIGLGGAVLFLISGIYTAYTSLRDALFPGKSTLARSIRSQLPYPDEAPDVRELFAMVDRDISANGKWFDNVAVGKEWVLGDMASYIPRIRVFFGRDEIKRRTSGNGRTQITRILELYILDDRRQCQITTLHNPNELKMLVDCISLRAPEALCRPYSEYAAWCQKSDMEWEDMLREYRVRQGEKELKEFRAGNTGNGTDQSVILTCPDGSVTSRVSPESIHQILMVCLREGEGTFSLTPGRPVEQNGVRFAELECFASFYGDADWDGEREFSDRDLEEQGEAELLLKLASAEGGEVLKYGRVCQTDIPTAERILQAWLRGAAPDLEDWQATPIF